MRHIEKKRGKFLILLTFVISLLLASCGNPTAVYPVSTSIALTPCPTMEPFAFDEAITPKFHYVMVEGSQAYEQKTKQSFELIKELGKEIIKPGDRLVMSWIEQDLVQTSIFLDIQSEAVPPPSCPPIPLMTEMEVTATATQNREKGTVETPTKFSKLGQMQQQTEEALATTEQACNQSTAVAAKNQATHNHGCDVYKWSILCKNIYEEWRHENEEEIEEFNETVADQLGEVQIGIQPSKSHLLQGLGIATKVIKEECVKKPNGMCLPDLILFSDLGDIQVDFKEPEEFGIDLSNVDVFVVLWDCQYLYDTSRACTRSTKWGEFLTKANAKSVTFIPGRKAKEDLSKELGR